MARAVGGISCCRSNCAFYRTTLEALLLSNAWYMFKCVHWRIVAPCGLHMEV